MNSNWSRLKRKLDENKHNNSNNHKRRRLTPPNTPDNHSKNNNSSKTNNTNNNDNNKPFMTKYFNSSSNTNSSSFDTKTQNYRKNTSKKQLFETIDLIPPTSTNNNMQQRKAFWNDLRLKLRSRLPKQFLFKIITPLNHENDHKTSSKLHEIKPNTKHTNIMALDCEMVGIHNNKSVLARISIVNYFGDVIYDKFVRPKNDAKCLKITDYREQITGITKHDLIKYGIPFEQCQQEIIKLLKGVKIIGHAIDNDFAVIKCANILKKNFYNCSKLRQTENNISNRKMRKILHIKSNELWFFDTSKCELLHDDIARPRSLKFLLELYLGIHIQSHEHDSVIDAISTMAIYRAILPEIKAKSKKKIVMKRKSGSVKKDRLKRKEERKERVNMVKKNQCVMNNYAYGNELDRLIAQHELLNNDK